MITGKPLPKVTEDIPAPSQTELDALSAKWNATVPQYYKSLLDAGKPESRFDYNKKTGRYIHRKSGRVLDDKEVKKIFVLFMLNMKVG